VSGSRSRREEFLAGARPEDVALYLADAAVDGDLGDHGEPVDGGTVLVVDGERGRAVFSRITGGDVMGFAGEAMGEEGTVGHELTGGECPDCDGDPRFVFAFAEEQNEEAGGQYAEGDVVHAYARCTCGAAYSDRWVADG
jgi:hypothetical protein